MNTHSKTLVHAFSVEFLVGAENVTYEVILKNSVPYFTNPLPESLHINVVRFINGTISGPELFRYSSPVVKDEDSQEIIMAFEGIEQLKGSRAKISGDHFILDVDLKFVNEDNKGTFTLKIELGDNVTKLGSTHTIKLLVESITLELDDSEVF